MTSPIGRRAFLKLAGAATSAGIVVPAFTPPREPYVREREAVDHIGLAKHPAPTFIGAALVLSVGDWDGIGFPCVLENQSFGPARAPMPSPFYDFDLSNFRRDLPPRFWHDPERRRLWPNVHAFVRHARFGEHPEIMCRRLGQTWPLTA